MYFIRIQVCTYSHRFALEHIFILGVYGFDHIILALGLWRFEIACVSEESENVECRENKQKLTFQGGLNFSTEKGTQREKGEEQYTRIHGQN